MKGRVMGGGGDFRGERERRDRMGERNKGKRKGRGERGV